MSDTLPDIEVSDTEYKDLNNASGIAAGENIIWARSSAFNSTTITVQDNT